MLKPQPFFQLAQKYAPNNKYLELIDNYIKACDLAIEMNSEFHQVGEYYSSACGYYDKGQWSTGDREIEKGNEHLEIRDNLVLEYNEYLCNIEALLADW